MYLLRRENQNAGKTEEKNRKPVQCSVPNVKKTHSQIQENKMNDR